MSDGNDILDPHVLDGGQEAQWISLSDMMTGLMMVFMLVAIAFMIKVEADARKTQETAEINEQSLQALAKKAEVEAQRVKEVAVVYDETRAEIYKALQEEFSKDLPQWGAEISKDLTVRFNDPDVLFTTGQNELKPRFKEILDQFFPRYAKIINCSKFRPNIEEVRIEGHTSSGWGPNTDPEEAYFKNMELSQARTRTTLRYVLGLPSIQNEVEDLRKYMTANGLSSSHPILGADGKESPLQSQRVEFHIRTNADAKLAAILQAATQQ